MHKLMMIDDNQMEHFIAGRLIKNSGLFAEEVHFTCGLEAINNVEKNLLNGAELPDVILLDLNMPGFSGWDFLERYKTFADKVIKNIDIHILSSSVDTLDQQLVDKYAFVKSYIVKPLKAEALINIHKQCSNISDVA